MEKKRKLKRFVMPSIYVALVAILVISTFATFANMKSVNEEEKINYVSNGIWTNDTPVASVEKVIVKPYTAKDVAIGRYFYDYRDEGTQQQNAIIFYENSYIQNSGVDYILDNQFDVVSIYDGTVTKVEDNELAGSIPNGDIRSVVIPNTVKSIGERAFANNKITSVIIESSETQICCDAFNNNSDLTSIKIAGVDTSIDEIPYVNCK